MVNKSFQPTNELLNHGLNERVIPLEVRPVVNARSNAPISAMGVLGPLCGCPGESLQQFADKQGRSRELLIYMLERASRHARSWQKRGFKGTIFLPLGPSELTDRTLATSLDIIAESQEIGQHSLTVIVNATDFFARFASVAGTMHRIRKVGCGVALEIDGANVPKFRQLQEHPFTDIIIRGQNIWKKLRTSGPGKLGELGSWIGWAEARGIQRVARDIANASDVETARLYGFGFLEGSYFADYVPARDFTLPSVHPEPEIVLPDSVLGTADSSEEENIRAGMTMRI